MRRGAAVVELPLGPVHAGLTGEWSHASASDLYWTGAALRLGGDRHYWPHARAGVGPVIDGGLAWLGSSHAWSITIGYEIYAAD